jgi:subtilase family serine protease
MRSKTLSFLGLLTLVFCPAVFAQRAERTVARPSWATPERLRGRVEGATPVTVQVHLEAAKAELEAVSDPDSPRYGQYLTSEEFESRYSPTLEDIAAVRGYFESEGFSITYAPRNRLFVSARATAAEVERVFATRLGQYEVEGELRRAPMEPARMPLAIASRVSAVLGLSTPRVKSGAAIRATAMASSSKTAPTCADYYGEYFDTTDPPYGGGFPTPTPLRPCGFTPPRVRRAYSLDDAVESGNDGRGVRIAILDPWRSPTLVSDAQRFAAAFDPAHPLPSSQITLIDAPSGGDPPIPVDVNWYYEQVGDVEEVHAIAPGAHIVYVGAATTGNEDVIAALNLIVQDKLASIISNSYVVDFETAADSDTALLDPILIQAGLKGIGTYFGAGDWGDNQLIGGPGSGPSVFYPASSPYTTAVGGTSLYLDRDGLPAYETGWESGESVLAGNGANAAWSPSAPGLFIYGAGGGPSQLYPQPKYQWNAVPEELAGAIAARVIPDVAMLADFDSGVPLGITDPFLGTYVVYANAGGTSLATPLFAATMALAEQRAGRRIGFANPKLYRVASQAFRDIVPTPTPQAIANFGMWTDTEDPPDLQVQRPDGSIVPHTLHSAPGFDNVTGLGVPAGEQFLQAIGGNWPGN